MAQHKHNLTATMAILGLIIQQPDTTRHVRDRLAREYPHGRWSRSIAHNNVKSLAERGLIRKIRDGQKTSDDLYEATPEGIASFKAWLSHAAKEPAPVRDAMQLWLEHSDESDLPEIIRVVKEVEEAARTEFKDAQTRLASERIQGRLGPPDGSDWGGRIREAVLNETILRCGHQVLRLKNLRATLENPQQGLHTEVAADGDG